VSDNISQDVAIRGKGNIIVGKGDVVFNPIPPAEARLRHDLGILLKNVKNTWIKGVLEKSVHEAALLELGMELRDEAVDNPWRMVMERPDQSREELPKGRKVKDIFDEANRLLLIMGEPGSGKTTTLLQLARDLIAEVDEAFTQPIPVILNLSTWTNKQQPLDEWLIEELKSPKYRVPKKDGRKWLTDRRILPLLDGLDEVRAENRAACVEKINQLVEDYGLHGLVVCCRVNDYTDLDVRLAFYRAIYLQPLTPEQIDEYMNKAGDKLANLRATLETDVALREMAQSPLILNIMSLAYQDTSSESLIDPLLNTQEARTKHLFDTYITRMFNRKTGEQKYDNEQTKQLLSWLAWNMQQHNQEVFLMENLQPSWLQTHRWRLIYTLVSRFSVVLIFWLIYWLIIRLIYGLSVGLIGELIVGLLGGMIVIITDILRLEWLDKLRDQKVVPHFWWSVIYTASIVLLGGLLIGLIFWLSVEPLDGLNDWLYNIATFVAVFWIWGIRKSLMNDVQTVEALRWNWGKALKGGLIVWLLFGLIGGLTGVLNFEVTFLGGLLGGLLIGVFFGLIGGVFSGLIPEIVETKTTPNQGIGLSAKNAIYGTLIVGLIAGLVFGLIGLLTGGLSRGNMSLGLIIGLVGVLWYGGLGIIQHYVLRLIIIIQGHTPRDYARFLDYAVDRIFLQKVGGGYRFIHRMLLEHFANMQVKE